MLVDDLEAVVAAGPGRSASQLASDLGWKGGGNGERAVLFALLAHHGRFRCDRGQPPRWWLANHGGAGAGGAAGSGPGALAGAPIRLYQWQADALVAWADHGRRGVVEAVTGTGKTMVGIAAALHEIGCREQVLVLVPTIELQRQWVAELAGRLPASTLIGRLGDGATDNLTSHDVLVTVVNSARAIDVRPIRRGGLLVADECHRYGSAVNQLALDRRFSHRLGLSATYGRDDDGNRSWLDPYFGGTCFQMGYRRALADDVTAHFTVALVGVSFSAAERDQYEQLTDVMGQHRARLIEGYGLPAEPFEAFMAAVNALADGDGSGSGAARSYRTAMLERRRLLADTPAKDAAVAKLAPALGAAGRAIVFTQSIAASERLRTSLGSLGLRAGAVHSAMSGPARRAVLGSFEAGDVQVISAPRVLDEGIDVPAADLAVIAGASRSRRQMVQRMGRVLRRKDDGRRARFAILYVEATVEDPHQGAHGTFLDEVVDVADEVRWFPAEVMARDSAGVCAYLHVSYGAGQSPPRMAPAPGGAF